MNEEYIQKIVELEKRVQRLETQKPRWVNWTPTITQSSSVTISIYHSRYLVLGSMAFISMAVQATSAGVAGNAIVIGAIPTVITPKYTGNTAFAYGVATVLDIGTTNYAGFPVSVSTTTFQILRDGASWIGQSPSFALANTDRISMYVRYERA